MTALLIALCFPVSSTSWRGQKKVRTSWVMQLKEAGEPGEKTHRQRGNVQTPRSKPDVTAHGIKGTNKSITLFSADVNWTIRSLDLEPIH